MTMYAVSHIDWYDHKLITEFHEAESPREAVLKHSKVGPFDTSDLPQTMPEIKIWFFDCDSMVEAVPVPKA